MEYVHTQPGWVIRILIGIMILIWIGLLIWNFEQNQLTVAVSLPVSLAILGCFWSLTVEVSNTHLTHSFSWGFWKRTYSIQEITSVEVATSQWYYGYGIRYVESGWMYNVSGSDVLLVKLSSGQDILLGTDDIDTLHTLLSEKISS